MKTLLVGLIVASLALHARATSPKLNSISPAGAQRGAQLELRLNGARLDDAEEIVFIGSGIEVLELDSAKANQVRANIKIAPDCSLGEHKLRVRTKGGVSDLRTFWVSAFTNIVEVETNNVISKAQSVPLGVTINGSSGGDDVDFFRVEAKKGQRVSAEVEAIRLGRAMLDPLLAIRDADGKVLASADDTTLLAQDCAVSIVAPDDGAYFIELRDSTYTGNGGIDYRLHIGSFPRPMTIYPLGGKAGESVSFIFSGDAGGEFTQEVKLPSAASEKFGVFPAQDGQSAPSPNWIRVAGFGNVLEAEPNDTKQIATTHSSELPIAFNGIISKKGDVDWFRFTASKDQALDIAVYARRLRSPLDSSLELFDANGKSIASNDDAQGPDSAFKFTVPADGEYLLRIRDQFDKGGPDFTYRIEVTPQQPSVVLSIPQVARNDSQSRQFIAVPRGNRVSTMISAKRANLSADLNFSVKGMPQGVALIADVLPGKLELEPLVFEAAADAPITGTYVDLVAEPTDTSKAAASSFRHDVEFVSGPNNTYYYSSREEKLYVAVTEAAPFKLSIVEPKAPLVQNGAMELRIVAERDDGFDEPITVAMMWKPPGVGALPDITIPKGSNSAIYQLNANGNAEVKKWNIAVLGSANVKGGPVFVSSQLAALEVDEPFVIGKVTPVSVSPGQEAQLVCKLEQKKPFDGAARVRLLGLPDKITASEAEISSSDKEVVFNLKVDPTLAPASYRNFFCAAEIKQNEQIVRHNLGVGGVIRVVPPKKVVEATTKQVAKSETK